MLRYFCRNVLCGAEGGGFHVFLIQFQTAEYLYDNVERDETLSSHNMSPGTRYYLIVPVSPFPKYGLVSFRDLWGR